MKQTRFTLAYPEVSISTSMRLIQHLHSGEIKRREVSWTLMKKFDTFAGPGDEEEGGAAGPSS